MVELTAAPWVNAFFIVVILLTMALKRETPIVCVVGSLILSWEVTGSIVKAVQAVFNAITVAASELLGIVVIISMIVVMAKMLEETGLAEMMFRPVFLIASFFFMGSPGTAKAIFGEGARGLLFDLGQALAQAVPLSRIPVAVVQAVVGGPRGSTAPGSPGCPWWERWPRPWVRGPSSTWRPSGPSVNFSPSPSAGGPSSPGL
jgi:hypothetical protein